MGKLNGKVAVITGAGSGIGRATALAFASAGASVHMIDIRPERIEAVAREIGVAGGRATCHEADCSDAKAMELAASAIYEKDGRVDILQNGAGILVSARVEDLRLEDWARAINVNLWGVINSLHVFIPRMLNQGGGAHIVNIASLAGLVGFPFTAPYTATKFAVVGLTEA
ncbi:MAG: SDR family NAD(P)-dependent oxidoreductase, partial [Myxococcota bacterium]